jgi:hypothetical protein
VRKEKWKLTCGPRDVVDNSCSRWWLRVLWWSVVAVWSPLLSCLFPIVPVVIVVPRYLVVALPEPKNQIKTLVSEKKVRTKDIKKYLGPTR